MPSPLPPDSTQVLDLIGVGFGPSNLALAIAVREHNATADRPITARFLERQESFGWHRGMLIDDATMQVSFVKDLVTQRDPTSDFSFLSYLHTQDRLIDFVNQKSFFPLRIEFHQYFEWAAERVADLVSYGQEISRIRPVEVDGSLRYFDVESVDGTTWRARNVVLATGLQPRLPDGVKSGDRIWHNSELLHRVEGLPRDEASTFVVVGAGQSAAEVTAYLHGRFADADVHSVFTRFGYSPSDDSPFANRVFDPASVDEFHGAPEEIKHKILGYHANTNYGVVDLDLIDDLYRRLYQERVLGTQRLHIHHVSRATDASETPDGVQVTLESLSTGERTALTADVIVYATGYRPGDPLALLGDLADSCVRDAHGRPAVQRDYRLTTTGDVTAGVYVQGGCTEHTHGITSSLLSNNAIRAGEILRSVADQEETPSDTR